MITGTCERVPGCAFLELNYPKGDSRQGCSKMIVDAEVWHWTQNGMRRGEFPTPHGGLHPGARRRAPARRSARARPRRGPAGVLPAKYLEVGLTPDEREVVINHPDLQPDSRGIGHIVFSPAQARDLARLLMRKANECKPW